jgi:dienelactone hydrolase
MLQNAASLQWMFVVPFLATLAIAGERPPREVPAGKDRREQFLKLIDRPRVPLKVAEKVSLSPDGRATIEFAYDSESAQRVPGLAIAKGSDNSRKPVVIVLHGTGGNKDQLRPLLNKLSDRGFLAVAIDGRFAGARSGGAKGADAYHAAILETWKTGENFPFLYDTVWDILRLIDYVETRSDVDSDRIGAIGFSKGGMELYLAAAVDERLAAAVPCIGVQSFRWALDNDAWQSRIGTIQSAVNGAAVDAEVNTIDAAFIGRFYDRVVPGIDRDFDAPFMLPLIAPRPLLVINGDSDPRTPMPGLEICIAAARSAYDQHGKSNQFEFRLQSKTGHAVTSESEAYALDWLVRSLRRP